MSENNLSVQIKTRSGSNDQAQLSRLEQDERQPRGKVLAMYWGLVSAMFWLYIGANLATAYGTMNALIGLVLATVTYSVINWVLAGYAIKNGVSVRQFSRSLLGRSGSVLATIIYTATAIYYAVFEGSIVANAFQAYFGGSFVFWSAVVVLYSTPLVVPAARRFLDRINTWLMPIYALGLIAAIVVALAKFGYSSEWLEHSTPQLDITSGGPGWLAAYTAFLGVWIMMLYTFDYGSKGQPKDQRFHQNITFGPVFYFLTFFVNGLIGIFLIIAVPGGEATETGIAGQLVALLGLFGVFVVFASQTRINTANYFMSASNLEKLGSGVGVRLPGLFWTILAALIIFALMMLPVIEHMLVALAWQGVLVSGWVAIGVAHILLDRLHSRRPEDGGAMDNDFHGAHWPGLIAWVVSAAVGIGLLQAGTPWGAIAATTIGPVLAFGLYLVLRIASGRHSGYRSLPSEDQTVPSSRQ